MKIGFLRFNNPVELYMPTASARTLGAEVRIGLIHDWIKLGHEVTIYSPLPKFERDIVGGRKMLFPEPQIKWLSDLKYDVRGYPTDEDVLFIEAGSTNTKWSYNEDGADKSFIWRTIDTVVNFEGNVIFLHNSPLLPFPFSDSYSVPEEKLSDRNLREMFKVAGGPDALFKNKKWIILSISPNFDVVQEIGSRGHGFVPKVFDEGFAKFKYLPPGYSEIEPSFPINPNPQWDAIYIGTKQTAGTGSSGTGGKYCKLDRIKHFYDHKLFQSVIFGNWDKKDFEHARYLGQNKSMGSSYELRNNAWISVFTSSKGFSHVGTVSFRVIQLAQSGVLCVGDREMTNVEGSVSDELLVDSPEDVNEFLKWIKGYNVDDREIVRQEQLSKFDPWMNRDWKKIFEL